MSDEEEVWKIYPDYDFIEVSNLGRVRTKNRTITDKNGQKRFVKGRVLKQKDNGHGYMFVQFCPNGKHVHLYVHRMVATCFIPNPNNLPEVNHKDNDPTNNVVSNLEWCDRQYNSDYKKNFGTSSTEVLGRLVFAVNLKTGKILCFKSQNQAARQLRVNHGDINSVIKGKLNQAGGYCFTEDESEITEEKYEKLRIRCDHVQ